MGPMTLTHLNKYCTPENTYKDALCSHLIMLCDLPKANSICLFFTEVSQIRILSTCASMSFYIISTESLTLTHLDLNAKHMKMLLKDTLCSHLIMLCDMPMANLKNACFNALFCNSLVRITVVTLIVATVTVIVIVTAVTILCCFILCGLL